MKKVMLFICSCISCAIFTGCAGWEQKSCGVSSAVEAIKIETTGSAASGTFLPNLILGGAANSVAIAPAVKSGSTGAPVVSITRRKSFFGEIFGLDASSETLTYVGVPGETSKDTQTRVKSVKDLLDKTKEVAAKAEKQVATDTKASTTK